MNPFNEQDKPISWVVSRRTAHEALVTMGVFTVNQLARLPIETLVNVPGIGVRTAPRIHALANAFASGRPYWIRTLPTPLPQPGQFLDIRVDPDTRPQIPWGFCWRESAGGAHFICVDPLRPPYQVSLDERSRVIFVSNYHDAWQRLAEMITLHQDAIYYWGKVIHTHLHQTGPTPVQNQLKPYLIDLHHIFADTVAVPARSTGLQAIANYLGYHWQGAKAPYEAHIAYLLWISEKRLDLLHEACTYMEHNAQAVEHIWRWLTFHAPGNGP